MLCPGTRVTTASGRELELTCRAKCGPLRGWFARPCRDGVPDRDRECWICDDEITGILSRRGQYMLPLEEVEEA